MVFCSDSSPPCLEIKGVCHDYGQKAALRHVSLGAQQSEVLALLGPSGSGKSTLLAVIAGIVKPSQGKVLLHGGDLLDLSPESRGLGMVFQDFALWPHMTVSQNVAFPLRARGIAPSEIANRTESALMRVGLQGFEGRRPHQLSGGQQQRVALARAVVAEPQLLLLDEPLSALDPATRASVRSELAEILQRLNITTIIVTHDREEAFELADRIAVLVDGQIQQHATPEEVYERPANLTVARFMGINLLSARLPGDGGVNLDNVAAVRLRLPRSADQGPVHLAIVPEQTRVVENHAGLNIVLPGKLIRSQYRGGEYRIKVRLGNPHAGQIVEARSKDAPREDRLFIHLPEEAIHVIHGSAPTESLAPINRPSSGINLNKLREEIL
jgi:ABC-type Fe3+/spermidine/putrescine transport system ATPase subunit